MAGVVGAEVKTAWAWCNTWGTAASVTSQVLIQGTAGLQGRPQLVQDESYNQTFLGEGEIGDYLPSEADLEMFLRYDGSVINWIAAAMGSPAAATVVSSQAANSLVAYSHVIGLAPELTKYLTLATDYTQYVLENPSVKLRGFTVRIGDAGRMLITFPAVGAKGIDNSTVNTNSTVAGAAVASLGVRVWRKQGVFRMNVQSAGALAAADSNSLVSQITFGVTRPLAMDHVSGNDYITEPDDSGWPMFPLEIQFARMNSVSGNSLAVALRSARTFKADYTFTCGTYINSTTQWSLKFEWPALQLAEYDAPVAGHEVVRPRAVFVATQAVTSPTGMAFVYPIRVTAVCMNSATLT